MTPVSSPVLGALSEQNSQPIHTIRFLHDQKAPMRDGVLLSADVFLPSDTPGPFPTILTRTPYESLRDTFVDRAVFWARRGYAFVIQDVRGRYESGGSFNADAQEMDDGIDTLDWVAQAPWCNGRIGMWGRSYGALTQWQVLRKGSPHLACSCPHVMADDYFHAYHYPGGAFQLALSAVAFIIWETTQALIRNNSADIFNNARFYRHLPLIDLDTMALGRQIPYWREWLLHPTNDAYWKSLNTMGSDIEVRAPVFQQGGWYDPYVESIFRNYNAITGVEDAHGRPIPQRVMIGPWSHDEPTDTRMGDLDLGPEAYVDLWQRELRWYDHWLKGIDTGLLEEPPILLFVMGANRWRYEHEWPLARTQYTALYLHGAGHANSLHGDGVLSSDTPTDEASDHFDYNPDTPVPTLGGVHSLQMMSAFAETPIIHGPVDQRPIERRDDLLVYTSSPLENDLEVTGPIEMILYAASSAPDTDFTAKLVDVHPDGRAMCISEGIIRARYRHSDIEPALLEPGAIEEYRIRLYPTSNVFLRGHRIRLDISSSNFPRFSRNLNTGEDVATGTSMQIAHQTIYHDEQHPSRIILPVISPSDTPTS
ncbi:MAG: CocE/NonD family hydrolase [Chloroflexota bacterium]